MELNEVVQNTISIDDESKECDNTVFNDSGIETETGKHNNESSEYNTLDPQNKVENDFETKNDERDLNNKDISVSVDANDEFKIIDSVTDTESMNDSGLENVSGKNNIEISSAMDTANNELNSNGKGIPLSDVEEFIEKPENISCVTEEANENQNDQTDSGQISTDMYSDTLHRNDELNKIDSEIICQIMKPLDEEDEKGITSKKDKFECPSCMTVVNTENCILLKDCMHKFCKECIMNTVQINEDPVVKCPLVVDSIRCNGIIQQAELNDLDNIDNACGHNKSNKELENVNNICNEVVRLENAAHLIHEKCDVESVPAVLKIWSPKSKQQKKKKALSGLMNELVELDDIPVIQNREIFDCPVCSDVIPIGQGIIIRDCLHYLCNVCLQKLVETTAEALVRCPQLDDALQRCVGIIQEREIKALVSEIIYHKYLEKSLRIAKSAMADSFHCMTPNCEGWCISEPSSLEFACPLCRIVNCLVCRAIHTNTTCEEFQEKKLHNLQNDETEKVINTQLQNREIMYCPHCKALVEKTAGGGGCDAIKCTICETELCWATRGARWGPKGKGDTSGGCRCKIDGQRCTPTCLGCH